MEVSEVSQCSDVSQCKASEQELDASALEPNVHSEVPVTTSTSPEPTVLGVHSNQDDDYEYEEEELAEPVKRPSIILEGSDEDFAACPSPLMEEHRSGIKLDPLENVEIAIMENSRAELKAKVVSIISIIISLVVGVRMVTIGISGGALAVFGLAGESLLDVLVSILVIWRYRKGDVAEDGDVGEAKLLLQKLDFQREYRATMAIGVSFFIFAVALFLIGLVHLFHEWSDSEKERQATRDTLVMVWPALVVYVILSILKVRLANGLDSRTLRQSAVSTMFEAMISCVLGLASLLELFLATHEDDDMGAYTVIDPVTSFFIAAFICGQGLLMVSSSAVAFQDHIELL